MSNIDKYQFIDIPTGHKSLVNNQECLSIQLPSDMRYVTVVAQLLKMLCQMSDPRATQNKYIEDLSTALRECCVHLIEKYNNPQLQFSIIYSVFSNRIEIRIEEPLADKTPEMKITAQAAEAEGYALHLIQKRVDRVSYQSAEGSGALTLVKYFVMPNCEL